MQIRVVYALALAAATALTLRAQPAAAQADVQPSPTGEAPATAPPAPLSEAAASPAPAPVTVAPATEAPPPAPAPAPSPPPAAAPSAPAWPASETECDDWGKNPPPLMLPTLESEVSRRYVARLIPVVGLAAGGGLGSDPGFGFRVGARADIGLLSPIWLSGAAYYMSAPESSLHVDLLTGISLVRWGTRWVDAGVAQMGGSAVAWNSHCQLRRNELSLLAGAKLVLASRNVTALQAGFGESFRTNSGFSTWGLTGLYDPAHPSYGGQVQIGFGGGFLPYPVYLGTVMGGMTGERKLWWGSIDVGAVLEL
jgi:hypothetical protein